MNDRVFLDSNVLVYAHTDIDDFKQSRAQQLITQNSSYISSQVIQELANTLSRKFKHPWKDVEKVLANSIKNNNLFINNEKTILEACGLADRYKFSFYDSLILSAALECECDLLFSEDLNNGQLIENKLKIVNPFV